MIPINSRNKKKILSFVIPVFNEELCIKELNSRLCTFAQTAKYDYEIVYINDGSTDSTLLLLRDICRENPCVKLLSFSRNFGHQIAVMAGLHHAQGDCVVVMDADLQDPPEVIHEMLSKWQQGFQVIYGVRQKRKEGLLYKICYHAFYRVWQKLSNFKFPLDAGDFCLLDQRVVAELKQFHEDRPFVRGLRYWAGFKHVGVKYERAARNMGKSKYNFWKLSRLAVDGFLSFSPSLIRMSIILGLGLSLVSIFYAFYIMITRMLMAAGMMATTDLVPGWATLVSGLMFLFGMQFIFMGILGEYISRIFMQTKHRPLYIVEEKIGFEQ